MVKFLKNVKRLKLKIASIFMLVLLLSLEFSPFAVKAAAEKLQFFSAGAVPVGWDSYNNKNVFYSYSTLGGNIAYCMDYTCNVPSGTMTFSRYLSDQAMAVLIHGYPYNSAADLGLANNEEAYLATQMALWEVLNRTGESHKAGLIFRVNNVTPKAGMEGLYQRTTAVAARLVSMAEASPFYEVPTLVVNTESVTIRNIGTDAIVGPYYVRVDGIKTSTLKSITASLENAPASARITDENGNNKTSIGNGDALYVRLSGTEDTVSFNVKFHSDVDKVCGRIYTTGGDVQDFCIVDKVPVSMDEKVTINWSKIDTYGQIRLTKVDQDDQPVSGAKFKLTNADTGEVMVESVETGDSGVLTFYKLPQGNYVLTEIEAPYGYEVKEATKNIYVKSGEMSNVKMVNDRITGRIVVTKVDDTNKPLANVTFEIYDYKGNPVTRITTGEDGKASANVGYGTYYFKEIECPAGYIMEDTVYEFKVDKENRTFYKTVTNERYKGSLIIIKNDDAGTPIKGVKFEITDENGNKVIDLTTNSQGKCGVGKLPLGKYYYQETYVPAEYKIDNTKHEFSITENNQEIVKTVVNERIRGSLKINKVNDDDRAIANVKFHVLDSNKQFVEELVTDANGEAISKELTPGVYYYKEIEVPSPYILDETEYKFEVKNTGELTAVKVVNHTATGKLKIKKYDSNQNLLSGVKFDVLDENGKVVDTLITDANGEAVSKELPLGVYYYKETEAPENVIMDTDSHDFKLTDNGQVITKTVVNKIKEGKLHIIKVDESEKPVAGVKFEILDLNEKVIDTMTTDENGKAESGELEAGTYYYREVSAPAGLVVDSSLHKFTIESDGQDVIEKVVNNFVRGSIKILKLEDGTTKALAGAKFAIIDKDKNVIEELVTDENGYAQSKELIYGTYYFKEIEAPSGYIIDTTEYEFTIENDGDLVEPIVYNVKARLPKTGGLLSDNMIIVLIVSLVSVIGYGFMKLISVKKENN